MTEKAQLALWKYKLRERMTNIAPDKSPKPLLVHRLSSLLFLDAIPTGDVSPPLAGRAGVPFEQENLKIRLGDFVLLDNGQPQNFDRAAASEYMKKAASGAYLKEDTVLISVSVGNGSGVGTAWGCDLSYDYVKINAEYTT